MNVALFGIGGVCLANLVLLLRLAFQYGALNQKVEDIEKKGCAHRRNGGCT